MKQELINYARGMNAKDDVLLWIEKRIKDYNLISENEHIIDYLCSANRPKRLDRATFQQMKSNAEKWNNSLLKKDKNIKTDDTKIILDFGDGFKFVELISKADYEREGNLMRHCVASYFGKDKEIYSLRDSENMPHCTVEKDQQIKGKGNGNIHPKYIDYVVRFLEWSGMNVRDSEMQNLGYIVPKFCKYIKNTLYRKKYIRKNETVKYKSNIVVLTTINDVIAFHGKKKLLFDGSIDVRENAEFSAPLLSEVSGSICVRENAKFSAPLLSEVSGSIDVRENAKFSAPLLSEVSGSIYVRENAKFSAPLLSEVSGSIYVRENAKFSAPLLKKSGFIDVSENAEFSAPLLSEVSGSIYVSENAEFSAPLLKKSGSIYVRENAKFSAPLLSEVSGSIDVRENAEFSAPLLSEVSGSIYVSENAEFSAPLLSEVSGSIDVSENAEFSAPLLSEVSGSIDVRENAKFSAPLLTKKEVAK
jgi:uncharacterized SAM-binding protein YcdF (DUF218 family)